MKKGIISKLGIGLLAGSLMFYPACGTVNQGDLAGLALELAALDPKHRLTPEQRRALRSGSNFAYRQGERMRENQIYYPTTTSSSTSSSTTTSIPQHVFRNRYGNLEPEKGYIWANDRAGNYDVLKQGEIEKVWVDFNKIQNGQKGMIIHTQILTRKKQNKPVQVSVYFHHENGNKLMDKDGSYSTPDRQVAVSTKDLYSPYESTRFEDETVFMPINQFDLNQKGKHNLKFQIQLWNKEEGNNFVLDNYCCQDFFVEFK